LGLELCERRPWVGVFTFGFSSDPAIDMSIKPLGGIDIAGDLPWLSGFIRSGIEDFVRGLLVRVPHAAFPFFSFFLPSLCACHLATPAGAHSPGARQVTPNKITLPLEQWWYPEDAKFAHDVEDEAMLNAGVAEGLLEVCLEDVSAIASSTHWQDVSTCYCRLTLWDHEGIRYPDEQPPPPTHCGEKFSKPATAVPDVPRKERFEFNGSQILELMVMSHDDNVLQIEVMGKKKSGKDSVIGVAYVYTRDLSKEGMEHAQNLELEDPATYVNAGYLHCRATYRPKQSNRKDGRDSGLPTAFPAPAAAGPGVFQIEGSLEIHLEQIIVTREMEKAMKLSDMTSRVFCIVKIDAPGKESVKRATEELSLRSIKGDNKIAAFNETFEFKVTGDETLKMWLVKKSKTGKDYPLAEWNMGLLDHLPLLMDSLPHNYNLESEPPSTASPTYPKTPAPVKFKVRFQQYGARHADLASPRPGSPGQEAEVRRRATHQ